MVLLAGDVGGTKTRLGLYTKLNSNLDLIISERYVSREFPSLVAIIDTFLKTHSETASGAITAACFGIPGPIVNERVKVTNLPWEFCADDVRHYLKTDKVVLVNDLVSTAASVPVLAKDTFIEVYAGNGSPPSGALGLVLAPGTGLGQAYILNQGGVYSYLPSESGHSNFAPSSDLEIELLKYLRGKLSHVSVESVLCGPGLVNIYSFLKDTGVYPESPELRSNMENPDKAATVAMHAMSGDSELCVAALDTFCRIMGAHASNVVLSALTTEGVYLGGGISPKIAPFLKKGAFLDGYFAKVKCRDRVEATPVMIINDDRAALIGSANIAATLVM